MFHLIEHELNRINRNSYSNTPSSYPLNYFAVIGEIWLYGNYDACSYRFSINDR